MYSLQLASTKQKQNFISENEKNVSRERCHNFQKAEQQREKQFWKQNGLIGEIIVIH